jgi:glycosyltransferase involved in cell wall biosynthesis
LHIIIFTESSKSGGLDTFIATLLNNWPNDKDKFTVVCNKSHPGLLNLRRHIERDVTFIENNILLIWNFLRGSFFDRSTLYVKVLRQITRMLIMPIQYVSILKLLSCVQGDKLLIINGGFPGGESCRLAGIAWRNMGNGKSIHNFHNFPIKHKFGLGWYEDQIDKRLIKSTSCFVSVSKVCANSLNSRGKVWRNINSKFIYNGVSDGFNNNAFNLRRDLEIGNSPLCLMLGTYEMRKGHEFIFRVFLEVLKQVPNACLVVCGARTDNELSRVLKIKESIVPDAKVHFLDFIPNGEDLISQVEVLLIGSQNFESFGYTAVEAMIRKTPVISTNTGGLSEVISDTEGGFTFEKNDILGFSNKVVEVLQNKKYRDAIGISGRKRALDLFSAERMSREYCELLSVSN